MNPEEMLYGEPKGVRPELPAPIAAQGQVRRSQPRISRLRYVLWRVGRAYLAGWLWYVQQRHTPPGSIGLPVHRTGHAVRAGAPSRPAREPAGGQVVLTRRGMIAGARLSFPFAVGALAYGVVFGFLARQAGVGAGEAVLMSAVVSAGAAQLVAIQLWASPLPIYAIVLTTLLINLRYLLFGAALPAWFRELPALKRYGSAFFLSDESWAVAMRKFGEGERDAGIMAGSGAALFAAWVTGTVFGVCVGGTIRDPEAWGIDFLFTAAFLTLLMGFWKGKRESLLPWMVAAAVAIVSANLLPGSWYILLGGIAGSVAGGASHAH